ncbi:MAG: hemin uptake protein HemP [Candidatus Rokubacteria bacterium]|nr:hemin uptake protein HemP [Candidatus Rokubacteria bacterium]
MDGKPADGRRTPADGRASVDCRAPLEERQAPRRIFSTSLFREEREVVIVHRGQEYRLRITKADKLILTK